MYRKILAVLILQLLMKTMNAQLFTQEVKYLIDKSFEHSSEIKINNYRINQSATDIKIALNSYLPRVSANATYTRLNDDIVFPENLQTLLMGTQKLLIKEHLGLPFNSTLPASVPLTPVDPIQKKDIFKVTGNAQMLLFSGFKIPMAIHAIRHQEKVIELLNEKEKNQLIVEVNEVYNKLALVLASESVLNSSEKLLNEQSVYVAEALKNGLATPIDRQKIDLAKQRLEVKRVEFNSNKLLLFEKLHQLTGLQNKELIKLDPVLQPLVLLNDSNVGSVVPRVEVKAINEALQALDYKQKMEKTEYIPKLAMFGQYEFRKQNLSILDPLWYAGLRLQWNIFDGFNARENIHKIEMDKNVYEEQKKAINELQSLAVTKAYVEFTTANQKIIMNKEQVSLAGKMYDMTNKQYKNGLATLTELLNSINENEKANFDLLTVYYEQRNAAIQLLDAKGILNAN